MFRCKICLKVELYENLNTCLTPEEAGSRMSSICWRNICSFVPLVGEIGLAGGHRWSLSLSDMISCSAPRLCLQIDCRVVLNFMLSTDLKMWLWPSGVSVLCSRYAHGRLGLALVQTYSSSLHLEKLKNAFSFLLSTSLMHCFIFYRGFQ